MLTTHFSLAEMIASQTAARLGIDNTPPPDIIKNLRRTATMLEEIRQILGCPIIVSSGYRCQALNKAVKGSKNSAHMVGLAADFTAPGFGNPFQVAKKIAAWGVEYDQLIHEFGTWVHVGLGDGPPRRQALSIFSGTGYLPGILIRPPVA